MGDRLRTVKGHVILLMVLFALIVSFLVLIFSFYMMYTFQRRITVQSVEFNLRLVASVIEQDMRDLTALGRWCGTNDTIITAFLAKKWGGSLSLDAWYRLVEEFYNNRSGRYVGRLLIFDTGNRRLLQVGNAITNSTPVTSWNVQSIFDSGIAVNSSWQKIIQDPFHFREVPVIPFATPLYNPDTGTLIGNVFLEASTSLVTDKLAGYSLPPNSELYLDLDGNHYLIEGNRFLPPVSSFKIIGPDTGESISPDTTIMDGTRDDRPGRYTMVRCLIRDGISLTQILPNAHFFPSKDSWPALAAALCLIILLLAFIITLNLDRNISRPVVLLRKRIDAISGGNFTSDPGIESDNELGQVGRGINRMAQEITALMDKRITDEKNKQDLEYRMLQSQINPHFLYNTLNSIKWMATIQNAKGIAEMTTALSRLLQTVSKDMRKMVPLGEELALIDDYLIIQKYRYGDSVTLIKKIEAPDLLDTPIPRFILQPLVENAIFHGIEPKGKGIITLEAAAAQDQAGRDVLVSITDNGVGMSADVMERIKSVGSDKSDMFQEVGVHNVDERLIYAFGREYGLAVASEEGRYTAITLRLPKKGREGD